MTQKVLHEENSRTALTVYEAGSIRSKKCPQYLAALIANLSAFSLGMCIAWSSAALLMLQKPESRIHITEQEGSWIGALLTLGAFIGAIPSGTICSKIGPKKTLQLLAFPLFASWVLIAYCSTIYGLYMARFLAGIAAGAICVAAPTYVAELAETKIRGTLGTLFQLQITIGLLCGYILGGSIEDFIVLALIPAVIPVVYLLSLAFIPESPVYLTAKGRTSQASVSLQWFRGENYDIEDEITRIRDNIKATSANRVRISDLYTCKATKKAMVIALGLMVFQQCSGINAVLFNAAKIFEDAGSSLSSGTCTIVIGVVQVLATYVSTLLIDKAGRRILLLVSSSVMSICLIILGIYFHLKINHDVSNYGYVPLASLALFTINFSIGFGPIPWIMLGELFNTKVKGIAMSTCAAFNWMLAFTITKVFQDLIDSIGLGLTFGLFGVICAFGTVFVLSILPETKGKDIDEIMVMLGGKIDKIDDDDDDDIVTINMKKV